VTTEARTIDLPETGVDQGASTDLKPLKTKKRTLTRRAVVWIGQTCNQRCYFCYFLNRIEDAHHPEHPFMSVDKLKDMCHTLRHFYGCTAIDIQGGEPTIYPGIYDIVSYCRDIGLYPTLITNGLHLAKPGVLEKFRDAGIRDFLVSFHGIGEVHDEVVGKKKAYEKMVVAVERMRELGIPFRFNCTMSKPVVPLLPDIAQKAIDYGALAVNYLAFNPFEDQETGIRTHENVSRYSEIKPYLTEAMDKLDEAGIEVNVRYLPLCMAEPRHRKNFYNFQQLSYDHHEWDYGSWLWTGLQPQRMKEGGLTPAFHTGWHGRDISSKGHHWRDFSADHPLLSKVLFTAQHAVGRLRMAVRGKEKMYREEAQIRAAHDVHYEYDGSCESCNAKSICDGFHADYAQLFGSREAEPITDAPATEDPTYFICEQEKLVEEEDKTWAM
jgi:sulfatase maturation enzyme AslB (radical SAM superfamily)